MKFSFLPLRGLGIRKGFIAVFFSVFILTQLSVAMVYYIDEKGVVHFVEDETLIPDKYKNKKYEVEGTKKYNDDTQKEPQQPAPKRVFEGDKPLVKDKFGNTPAYWKERYKSLQNEKLSKERELREAEEQRDELSRRFESVRSKAFYVGDSQSVTEAATLELKLRDLENRIKMITRQLDELNRKLSVDIYDELLQAGGDPSWLIMGE